MANKVTFDYSKAAPFVQAHEVDLMKKLTLDAKELLVSKTGAGNDFLGWVDLPVNYDKDEVEAILKKAEELKEEIEVLLVCGIGGSYLGARAAIEAINGLYPTNKVKIIYIGNTFSSNYLAQVKEYV